MKLSFCTSALFILFVAIRSGKFEKVIEIASSKNVGGTPVKVTAEVCICFEIWEPVCANDGQTYPNSCFLNCARRQQPFLLGMCEGECPCCKPPYQNEPLEESGWGIPLEEGAGGSPFEMMMPPNQINQGGFPAKSVKLEESKVEEEERKSGDTKLGFFPDKNAGWTPESGGCVCTAIYRPVCGSNNETYGNLCALQCAAKTDTCLTQACEGECPCCSCSSKVVYNNPN